MAKNNPALQVQLSDCLSRFSLPQLHLRAVRVNLHQCFAEIATQQAYPEVIRNWLGEALIANAMLASIIKISGRVILQINNKTDPIHLLATNCNHKQQMSGLVKWQQQASNSSLATASLQGQLVITIIQDNLPNPYQSIVELAGNSITHSIEHYFAQSEQLPSRLFFAVDAAHNSQGLLLQYLPTAAQHSDEQQVATQALAALDANFVQQQLQGNTPAYNILRTIWPQQDNVHHNDLPLSFKCQCTRLRMQKALLTMGKAECEKLLNQHQVITVNCDFCGAQQEFNRQQVEQLWH